VYHLKVRLVMHELCNICWISQKYCILLLCPRYETNPSIYNKDMAISAIQHFSIQGQGHLWGKVKFSFHFLKVSHGWLCPSMKTIHSLIANLSPIRTQQLRKIQTFTLKTKVIYEWQDLALKNVQAWRQWPSKTTKL
jgi:hypothetical protein